MINVSKAFRQALASDNRNYIEQATVTLRNGVGFELNNSNFWQNSFSLEDAVSSSENSFSALGSAIINASSLTINNIYGDYSDYDFYGASVVVYIGLNIDGTPEMVRKGTYTVDEATYNGSLITLKCLDNMTFFDRPYSESTLIYPASCDTIIRDACTICGVSLSTSSLNFQYKDTVIADRPNDEATTFREVISYIATICGCFARCNADGNLELKWFDQQTLESLAEGFDGGQFDSNTPYATGDSVNGGTFNPWSTGDVADGGTFTDNNGVHYISSLYNSQISVDDVVITGVQIEYEVEVDGSAETIVALVGTDDYVIKISDNPFITGLNIDLIKSRLGLQLIGLKFRKATVSHSSDPTIEAGDIAFVIDGKANVYPIFVTRTTFKVGSSQKTVCGASTPNRNSATRYSQQTKSFVTLRKEMKAQKTAYDQALEDLADRVDNANGLYETQVAQTGGGTITYMHNKPLLTDSDIQIMISDVGVTVTANGTAPQPTWYGLTVDGQLIASILNTVGVNADWINTGQLVISKNGVEVFFADVDTGTVRISGSAVSITAGDPISSAISASETRANNYTDEQAQAVIEYSDSALSDFADTVTGEIEDIQAQLDGVVDTYYYNYAPTTSNIPAVDWTTEQLKEEHEGDLFLDTSTGKSYRWVKENNVWQWKEIPDTASAQALIAAQNAQATADGKRRIFVVQPTPPYDVGDLWVQGSGGDILVANTDRGAGASYVATDWEIASKYTETYTLETPFVWSGNTANFEAIIYKNGDDVTSDYPAAWFEWTLRTENGESRIATGKTCSVTRSALGYGGTVTCKFTTYENRSAALTTRSLKALNTRSGLTLTTYVNSSGDQPVTELPVKTSSAVLLDDYLMGIDAADGYIVTVSDLATRMATGVLDARYVNVTGDTMTGNLTISKSSDPYVATTNPSMNAQIGQTVPSETVQIGRHIIMDNTSTSCGWITVYRTAEDLVYTNLCVRRKNTSGTILLNGLSLGIDASGNFTVAVSSSSAWRSALNVVNKSGDTITGGITHNVANSYFKSSNITRNTMASELTYGNSRVNFHDKDGNSMAQLRPVANTTYIGIELQTFKDGNTGNNLVLAFDNNGNATVRISAPSAWRSALGLAVDSSWTTVAPVIAKKQGNVVTVSSNGNHSSAISANTWTEIVTLPSGYRPSTTVYAAGMLRSTYPCVVRITSAGVVGVYSATASAASGSLRFSLSFVI